MYLKQKTYQTVSLFGVNAVTMYIFIIYNTIQVEFLIAMAT